MLAEFSVMVDCSSVRTSETHLHFVSQARIFCNMHTVTYHLSRSALMLAQAAGTGASAGAAAVSESDMSAVLLWGVVGACPVLFLSSKRLRIPEPPRETERERERERDRERDRDTVDLNESG